jgi:hypothetical protein
MNALTKRVIMFTLGLVLAGTMPVSALTRHVVVVPRVGVYRPFPYSRYWGPWYPYAYGYPYGYLYPRYGVAADIKTEITPKNAEVYVDGYYAGRASDFDGAFQAMHVVPGGHAITVRLDGFRTLTEDVYVRPESTFKMKATMQLLAVGEMSAPVPAPAAPPDHSSAF